MSPAWPRWLCHSHSQRLDILSQQHVGSPGFLDMFWVSKSQNSALAEGILSATVALGVHSLAPWEALPQAVVIPILFCIANVQFKGH